MKKRKRVVNKVKESTVNLCHEHDPQPSTEETWLEESKSSLGEREVEQRIMAIKAISNAEIDNLLSRIRLVRSKFSNEQLQTQALQFFSENLPNISVVQNEKYQLYELEWKGRDEFDNSDYTATIPASSGLDFSIRSVRESLVKATSLQIPIYALGELSENQHERLRDSLLTPGVSGHRSSVGITPKSRRLPKHGELLVSVFGSPLGLYNEEGLEVINESGDGKAKG